MEVLVLVAFVAVVVALTVASRRSGSASRGCCAPADPADDLRMRP
jgi:hypothetical protein